MTWICSLLTPITSDSAEEQPAPFFDEDKDSDNESVQLMCAPV
jgi:hypothetical protein